MIYNLKAQQYHEVIKFLDLDSALAIKQKRYATTFQTWFLQKKQILPGNLKGDILAATKFKIQSLGEITNLFQMLST